MYRNKKTGLDMKLYREIHGHGGVLIEATWGDICSWLHWDVANNDNFWKRFSLLISGLSFYHSRCRYVLRDTVLERVRYLTHRSKGDFNIAFDDCWAD